MAINPKKEASCEFPISKVKEAIKNLPAHTDKAVLDFSSDIMGCYKFICKGKGIFNLGMFLDVTVHKVSDETTKIQLECRRQVGVIDTPAELTECTEFMLGTYSLLGKVLSGEKK